jgi:hypothetical protein
LNLKKDVLVASVLAVILSGGLAVASYALITETLQPQSRVIVLDVYTQKGGLGANTSGGVFEPSDTVVLYAYLTSEGLPMNDTQVNFTAKNSENEVTRAASTNSSGVAAVDLILPSNESAIGTWNVLAVANAEGQSANDTLSFECYATDLQLSVHTEKDGLTTAVFVPTDNVSVVALLTYKDTPVADAQVDFEVSLPNGTVFLTQSLATDSYGIATVKFQIPWPSNDVLGDWRATVQSEVFKQHLIASSDFECQLLPMVIDVFTDTGGRGQNVPDGTFMLNDTVYLYAEIRDALNATMADKVVGLTVEKQDGMKFLGVVAPTNASGIAMFTFHIPLDPSLIGTMLVIARAEFNDTLIMDSLTFTVQAQS